jgi:formylglycine-generating enzyme required for sulfatase activity
MPDNGEPQRLGTYVVLNKLGEGGMGTVYKAHDPTLNRSVALKLLPPHLAHDPEFVTRFKHEATAAAKLSHGNLVHVYAVGEEAGTHYIAMEFVEGGTLLSHIRKQGVLSVEESLAITIYTAEALRYAWNHGRVIHRDIKPENILLSNEGEVKIADMGLAKSLSAASLGVTASGTVMGSPHYISPEQARGDKDIDFRTDIYSLGCTLFHMLTGRTPYEGDNLASLIYKHVHEPPPDLRQVRSESPPHVAALLNRMMAKDRDQRPSSYDDLITELTALYNEAQQAGAKLAAARTRVCRTAAEKKKLMVAGAAVAVLAVAGIIWVVGRVPPRGAGTRPAPPAVGSGPTTTAPAAPTLAGLKENLTVDLGGGVTMQFVLIRPDTFTMGSDECSNATPHKVTITKPFYLGKFEVTQEQWQAVMGSNPSRFKGSKNPVEMVSWEDCQKFIQRLGEKVPGQTFRLPTEAEWEYACRAGSTTEYGYGDDDGQSDQYAWHKNNSGVGTHPVGEKKPNAWGLYDMHGNVREWCQDWYGEYDSSAATDPVGPSIGSNRVLRGGSWDFHAASGRCANRLNREPSYRTYSYGSRVVVDVSSTGTSTPSTSSATATREGGDKKVGGASAPRPPVQEQPGRGTEAAPTLAGLEENRTVDLGGGVNMEFVLIPAGTFTMGSAKCSNATPHQVTLTKPFCLGKYEVTQEQWQAVVGSNPSEFKGPKNPVEKVSWEDCQKFLRKLQEKVPGQTFRLPTEAEWEYACRAGSTTMYCYGSHADGLGEYAWCDSNSGRTTHPVGEKKPNAWGLYDMHGNVMEWCQDLYGAYESGAVTDPVGPPSGLNRVMRGGSWNRSATICRSVDRRNPSSTTRLNDGGLRVVVEAR